LSGGTYLRLYDPDNRVIDESKKPKNIVLSIPPAVRLEDLTEEEQKTISATTVFKSPMEIKSFDE